MGKQKLDELSMAAAGCKGKGCISKIICLVGVCSPRNQKFANRGIAFRGAQHQQGPIGPERFIYQPESNSYLCPAGRQLNYGGHSARNRTHVYIGTRKRCGACAQKAQCTGSPLKYLAIHVHEPARQRARDLINTSAFVDAQRNGKKVEALFAELKNQIGLRRLRLRRLKFVREQFFLAATAQNIKRLVRFLSHGPRPQLPAAT
jgi:Transposase DDE domain